MWWTVFRVMLCLGVECEVFSAQLKQSRQSSAYGRASLLNFCRRAGSPRPPWQQVWSVEEEEEEEEQRGEALDSLPVPLEELQRLCRVLRPRQGRLLHDTPDYLNGEHDSDNLLKRKSPYILKRQLHTNKSRRPYILKRSPLY
ncbi:neurotensin/neuromedin N [Aplochiton taeniatus]